MNEKTILKDKPVPLNTQLDIPIDQFRKGLTALTKQDKKRREKLITAKSPIVKKVEATMVLQKRMRDLDDLLKSVTSALKEVKEQADDVLLVANQIAADITPEELEGNARPKSAGKSPYKLEERTAIKALLKEMPGVGSSHVRTTYKYSVADQKAFDKYEAKHGHLRTATILQKSVDELVMEPDPDSPKEKRVNVKMLKLLGVERIPKTQAIFTK